VNNNHQTTTRSKHQQQTTQEMYNYLKGSQDHPVWLVINSIMHLSSNEELTRALENYLGKKSTPFYDHVRTAFNSDQGYDTVLSEFRLSLRDVSDDVYSECKSNGVEQVDEDFLMWCGFDSIIQLVCDKEYLNKYVELYNEAKRGDGVFRVVSNDQTLKTLLSPLDGKNIRCTMMEVVDALLCKEFPMGWDY
jgi:hypothetical protein